MAQAPMKSIRPYRIGVVNRITDAHFAEFYSNQVPDKGDQVHIYPVVKADPFRRQGLWVVDHVSWLVAGPASVTAFEVARETDGDMAAAYCEWVELHVWPAPSGPYWQERPAWAKILSPDDDEDEGD
jgi:hypothetical protein